MRAVSPGRGLPRWGFCLEWRCPPGRRQDGGGDGEGLIVSDTMSLWQLPAPHNPPKDISRATMSSGFSECFAPAASPQHTALSSPQEDAHPRATFVPGDGVWPIGHSPKRPLGSPFPPQPSSFALSLLPCGPGAFFLLLPWGVEREGGERAGSPRGARAGVSSASFHLRGRPPPSMVADIRGGLSKGLGIHPEPHMWPQMWPGGPPRVPVTDHVPSFHPRT